MYCDRVPAIYINAIRDYYPNNLEATKNIFDIATNF
jgi:hypothetical protein